MELSATDGGHLLMLRLRHLSTRSNNPAQDQLSSGPTDLMPFYRGGPQRFGRMALALGLALLATWMLWSFVPAIAWAGVLAIATWPLYRFGQPHLGRTWTAAGLVTATALILFLPLLVIGIEMAREFRRFRSMGSKHRWRHATSLAVGLARYWRTSVQLVAKLYGRFIEHC